MCAGATPRPRPSCSSYAEKLIALAHRQLSARLAQRVAPEDVVQSVYCSFFVGSGDGQFVLQRSGDSGGCWSAYAPQGPGPAPQPPGR